MYNAFTGEAERAFAAGGVVYVMIYLLALSGLKGALNLGADGVFLFCTLLAVWLLSDETHVLGLLQQRCGQSRSDRMKG
jgi:hypothetical protein